MKVESFMATEDDSLVLGMNRVRKEIGGGDIPQLEKYIADHPQDIMGYVVKAVALGSMKRFSDAQAFLTETQKRFPQNGMLHHVKATIYELEGKRSYAIKESRRAAELNPYSPEITLTFGTLLNRDGRYDEAIDVWESILKVDPRMGVAWNSLAKAEFEKGLYAKAINHMTAAMMLTEGSDVYYAFLKNRSQMKLVSGDLESALRDDQEILAHDLQDGLKHILAQPEFAAKKGKENLAVTYANCASSRFPVIRRIIETGRF